MIVDAEGQVRGQWLVCGMPGMGKSTLMRALCKRALDEDRALIIGHDPTGEWGRRWPGMVRVRTAREVHELAARAVAGTRPSAVSVQGSSTLAATLAELLGGRWNSGERTLVPIVLACDEGALIAGAGATHQSKEDREATAMRRHHGTVIAWNVQSPSTLPKPYWDLATDVWTYAITSWEGVRAMESRLGLDRGALAWLRRLPERQIAHLKPGRGAVALWGGK